MKTSFLGQAYASRSPILASQTAINIYPELVETGGSEVGGFYGTPGLQTVFTGSGEVRGLWVTRGATVGTYRLFAVIGSTVWQLDSAYNGTSLGTLPQNAGRVSMFDNGTQLAIAHQSGWHFVALNGTAIAPVAGAPSNSVLTGQDNYGLFTESTGGQFGLTNLGDLSALNALSIATAEGSPDDLISIISDHREVALVGTETVEIWTDTGAPFFPFERAPGGFIEQGCVAKWSPIKADNSVFWVGRDKNGRGVLYRNKAYIPERISTHAIENALAGYSDITDAIGYSYQEGGHTFCVWTFPTGDATWAYDVATKMWHQRAWMDSLGLLHRHRGNCHVLFNNDHLIGDWQNGKIYRMGLALTDDAGTPIYRERAWEINPEEHHKVRLDLIELIALTGDGDGSGGTPLVWLQISRDNGRRFGYERFQKLGKIGEYKARARWRRAGSGRDFVLRVATNMTQRISWTGANVQGEELSQ